MTVAPVSYGVHSNKCPPTTSTNSLLKTAVHVAPISSEGLRIQGNILFDDGSRRLFITEEVAIKLNLKHTNSEHIAVAPFGTKYMTDQQLSMACVYMETKSREVYQSLFLLSHLLLHHFKALCVHLSIPSNIYRD